MGWKTREIVVVLDFLAVNNFDFTKKIVKKFWVKNSWNCWGFVKIEFLDKKIDFYNSVASEKKKATFQVNKSVEEPL